MGNGLPYYGRKSEENCAVTAQLLPDININRIVDCCMGSGNFSRLVSCQMDNIERIAFELERSLYTLHMVIKDEKKLDILFQSIRKVPDTVEFYNMCELIVKNYNEKIADYDEVTVALAELVFICFSMNSSRNKRRNTLYYMKHTDEIKRNQKRIEIEALVSKFYNRLPADLQDMHYDWKKIDIRNESFIDNMDLWEDKHTFIYADVPYLLDKRGRDDDEKKKSEGKPKITRKIERAGYLEDWTRENHLEFIKKIVEIKKTGKLKASFMICSNFEVDEEGNLMGIADDPYTELMKIGFRMVVTEVKFSSAISEDKGDGIAKKKKCKAEVVYIDYKKIVGAWDSFQYFDYADVISGKVRINTFK